MSETSIDEILKVLNTIQTFARSERDFLGRDICDEKESQERHENYTFYGVIERAVIEFKTGTSNEEICEKIDRYCPDSLQGNSMNAYKTFKENLKAAIINGSINSSHPLLLLE